MASDAIDWDRVWNGDTSSVAAYVHDALEAATIQGRGRGVRTVAPLRAGELLIAEKALATAPESKLAEVLVGMQSSLDDMSWRRLDMMCDGEALAAFDAAVPLRAWPDAVRPAGSPQGPAEGCLVKLQRMRRIVDLNAYRCSPPVSEYAFTHDEQPQASEAERHEAYGVFPLGSLFNHTCAPNMSKVLLADWVFLRAARDIEPGEELTQFYCDIRMPVEMRQKELSQLFGFCCDCERCTFESKLQKGHDSELEPWKRLYSCEVPGFHHRLGPVQASQLEGVVAEAENSVRGVLNLCSQSSFKDSKLAPETQEQWVLWPLVPALQQLALRLRLDGRLLESVATWRRAERAASHVVPLSNIHLRIEAELLLTETRRAAKEALLGECLRSSTAAFGGGLQVWQLLFGFRMPKATRELAEKLATSVDPGQSPISFQWHDPSGESAALLAWSAAFRHVEGVRVDASPTALLLAVQGAAETKVACPFEIDVGSVQTRFSRRRRCLTIQVSRQ